MIKRQSIVIDVYIKQMTDKDSEGKRWGEKTGTCSPAKGGKGNGSSYLSHEALDEVSAGEDEGQGRDGL